VPIVRIDLVVAPEQRSDAVTTAIHTTAGTEQAGEDKILLRPIERAVRIRNGETGGIGWVNLNCIIW
jgi:nitrogen regulatory protein PII